MFEEEMGLSEGEIEVVAFPWAVKVDSCVLKGRVSLDEDELRRLGSPSDAVLD